MLDKAFLAKDNVALFVFLTPFLTFSSFLMASNVLETLSLTLLIVSFSEIAVKVSSTFCEALAKKSWTFSSSLTSLNLTFVFSRNSTVPKTNLKPDKLRN